MKNYLHTLLTVFICLLLYAKDSFAVTYTFTGSGNWSNTGNWSGGAIPPQVLPSGDIVIIDGSGTCIFNDPYDGSLFQMRGTMTINSTKTFTISSGEMRIEAAVFNVYGTLNANNSNGFDYDNGTVNIYGTVNVPVSDGFASYNNGNVAIQNGGLLNVNGGSIYIRGSGSVAAGGFFTLSSGGSVIVYYCTLTNNGSITNGTGCTFHFEGGPSALNNQGTFENNGSITNWYGSIRGSGTFMGSFSLPSNLTLAPGNSPGCMVFDADFISNGILNIELADGVACTNFDQIQVINGHAATIGGTINITFPSGTPSTTTFAILTSTGTKTDNSPVINWPSGFSGSGAFVGNEYQVSFSMLPVELVSFTGQLKQRQVALHWNTASETNNAYFEIQRSMDSKNWEAIGRMQGNGSSLEAHQYGFTDVQPSNGINYYRLKQVDFDGKYEFSKVVSVAVGKESGSIQFQPNLVSGITRLYVETEAYGDATLRFYNITGGLVGEKLLTLDGEYRHYELDLSDLPHGVFMAVVTSNGQSWEQRIVIN